MASFSRIILLFLSFFFSTIFTTIAQSGNQMLDGIGETALRARYLFNGNTKDWSRNNLTSAIYPANGNYFSRDPKFGNMLSLSASNKNYVSLAGEAVEGEESISVATWVSLKSLTHNQTLLSFGTSAKKHLTLTATNTGKLKTEITANDNALTQEAETIAINKWVHVAIVVNIPAKSLITYLNGKRLYEQKLSAFELSQLFDASNSKSNQLLIGKAIADENAYADANFFDFRLYRIPLSDPQINTIVQNALNGANRVNQAPKKVDNLPVFTKTTAQLYQQFITKVLPVKVETTVGYLPRLPSYIQATYKDGITNQKTRVIWPAPIDNQEVIKAGQYTLTGTIPGSDIKAIAYVTVKEGKPTQTPKLKLETFPLGQVSLEKDANGMSGKMMENRDKFLSNLANTDPDAFLYMFRNAFGQTQPANAKALGGWDTQDTKLRGHATGHYLTAIAQAYSSSAYDKALQANFKAKMEYMVNTLADLANLSGNAVKPGSNAISDPALVTPAAGKTNFDSDLSVEGIRTDYWNWGKGYISAYPPDQFIMLEKGATYGGQKTQIWAPYYTLHKILAGLLDVHEATGNKRALQTAERMGDWIYGRLSVLPTETLISMWNRYIAGEFGGMNEVMARLYRVTQEPRYLKVAELFDNIKVFYGDAQHSHGLARNVDTFRGLHANQHIPQILGSLEMYRNSGLADYYRIADNFWNKINNDYTYSIGGVAGARSPNNAECFVAQPATLYENGLSADGQNETCATYNMLKLTRNLFLFDQRGEYMDYYEKALYNHILASVAENTSANTYHVPLRPGSSKQFGNAGMNGFTCCNGTAIESSTKLQNTIYFKSAQNDAVYVNLFVASTLNWTEKKIKLIQSTSFPKEDHSRITVKGNGKFNLNLRVPGWAKNGYMVSINGKAQKIKAEPGTYITLNREWKDGDAIDIKIPIQFHLEPIVDQQNIASLFYGPILLAAQEPEARTDWRKVTFDPFNLSKSISGDPKNLTFTIDGINYKPFYDSYQRHSVYVDVNFNK